MLLPNAFELSGPPSILHPKGPFCLDGPINQQPGPRGNCPALFAGSALVDPALCAGQRVVRQRMRSERRFGEGAFVRLWRFTEDASGAMNEKEIDGEQSAVDHNGGVDAQSKSLIGFRIG